MRASQTSGSGVPILEVYSATALGVYRVPVAWIGESPKNERKKYDLEALTEMAATMKKAGINTEAGQVFWAGLKKGKPCYELVGGHRRLRALKLIGAKYMKVEIQPKADSEKEARKIRMTLNLQREDLTPLELAAAWKSLKEEGGYTSVEAMAEDMGMRNKANSIRDLIGLDRLAPAVRKELEAGAITKSHAVLLAKEDAKDQVKFLMWAFNDDYDETGKKVGRSAVSEHKFRQAIKNAKLNAAREAEFKKKQAAQKAKPAKPERDWEAEQRDREKKRKEEEARAAAAATVTIETIVSRQSHKTDLPIEIVRLLAKQNAPDPYGTGKLVRQRYGFVDDLDYKEQDKADRQRIEEMSLEHLYDFLLCSLACVNERKESDLVLGALKK